MTPSFYISRTLRALTAGTLIYLFYLCFGEPELFDRLFLFFLGLLFLVHTIRKDSNVLSVLIITVIIRLLDEASYAIMFTDVAKPISYIASAGILYYLRHDDWVLKLGWPIFILTVSCETYWFATSYNAPTVHYPMTLIAINFMMRHLLFMRVFVLDKYLKDIRSLNIDYQLNNVALFISVLVSAQQIEYFVRHLTPLNITVIYYAYPNILQGIAIYTMLIISDYFFSKDHKITA